MNRPTPAPLPGGERAFTRVFRFPSWEGLGVGSWSQCTVARQRGLSINILGVPSGSMWKVRFAAWFQFFVAEQPSGPSLH